MLQQIRDQRRHGYLLPRSKVVEQKRGKAQERTFVSRLNVVKTIDVFADPLPESALLGSKRVKEIIFAGRCVVVVTEGGVCRAYEAQSTCLIADLNPVAPWKKVTTAIYHANNDTVVVVFEPTPGGLQCQVFLASALERGQLKAPPISSDFENVVLCHPAFFEFDEANGVILAAQQGEVQSFQFWNHTEFKLLFSVNGEDFEEVRISHGLAAMFKPTSANVFSASVFDIEDGRRLAEIDIPIDQYRRVEFLELLVSKLLFKQDRASLRVIDLLNNGSCMKVPRTRDSFAPVGFVFFEVPERVMGKKYFDQRARRFFTISAGLVQFWILHNSRLDTLHSIKINGLREAGLCQQGIGANLLAVCPSHTLSDRNEMLAPGCSEAAFVSALELQKGKLERKQSKVFDPLEPLSGHVSEPTKRGLISSGPKSVHFFSMEDGQYVGSVPPRLCGDNVEVLQVSIENMAVGCGDHTGTVRLLHASCMAEETCHQPGDAECPKSHVAFGAAVNHLCPEPPFNSSAPQLVQANALPVCSTPSAGFHESCQNGIDRHLKLTDWLHELDIPLSQRDPDAHCRTKRALRDPETDGRTKGSRLHCQL